MRPSSDLFDIVVVEEPIEDLIEAEDLPEKAKRKYLNDAKYLREHSIEPGEYPGISAMQSKGYPNYDYNIHRDKPADTRKWLEAARQIYYLVHNGEDRGKALDRVVGNWNKMDKSEFFYWLRFYEEGAHLKYKAGEMETPNTKTAQFQGMQPSQPGSPMRFFDNVKQPGYYMPMNQQQPLPSFDQMKSPTTHPDVLEDIRQKQMAAQEDERKKQTAAQEQERREQIEEIRAKWLSRLDSAERIARTQEAHMLAGNELNAILTAIHDLKRKILTVNKVSTSTRLYEDLIVRQANILTKNGFFKGAEALHKLAQAMPAVPEANNPLQVGGAPGNLPGLGPGMTPDASISNNDPAASLDPGAAAENPSAVGSPTAIPTDPAATGMTQSSPTNNQTPGQNSPSAGMSEFLKGMEEPGTFEDEDEEREQEEHGKIAPASLALGLKLQAALVLEHFLIHGFVREAQMVPEDMPTPEPTEVKEDVGEGLAEQGPDPEAKAGTDFDKVIDTAFQQLTIADVVSKLEDLTKVFKVREIPRQLAIVDMMLDRLGLASFFPSLGECVQKSHEANNYVSTRLETILSGLRGTMPTKNLDLEGDNAPTASPEAQAAQSKLQQAQETEQNRKKMSKDLANRELENAGKPKPDLEVAEDLGAAPAQMPTPPPAPAPAV